jgi:hypothetical protein
VAAGRSSVTKILGSRVGFVGSAQHLLGRRSRAEQEGWLGGIDGLDLTLNLLRHDGNA